MQSIKLITDSLDFYFSDEASMFELITNYLQRIGYKSSYTLDEIKEFKSNLCLEMDLLISKFKASTRIMQIRLKQINYKDIEYRLNLSEPDHLDLWYIFQMLNALETTKNLSVECNSDPSEKKVVSA